MDTTLYVGLSHQAALRRNMDLIANNIANLNTTAYRREQVIFQEYLVDIANSASRDTREVAFVEDYGVARDLTQGPLTPTGNPLDVAIEGKGYFSVQNDDATDPFYTRNGRFVISPDGYLSLTSGHKVLDTSGQPIPIGPEDADINIAPDGTIASSQGPIAQINVVSFDDERLLQKVGDNLYSSEQGSIPADEFQLQNGMLEASNVNGISEMTQMIEVLRTYQSTSKMLDRYQDLRSRGIERLGRVQ
jgi:flagellar basal-body rod protein FlgF